MDPKLQDAYAALEAAHTAGNTQDATSIADYIVTLQASAQKSPKTMPPVRTPEQRFEIGQQARTGEIPMFTEDGEDGGGSFGERGQVRRGEPSEEDLRASTATSAIGAGTGALLGFGGGALSDRNALTKLSVPEPPVMGVGPRPVLPAPPARPTLINQGTSTPGVAPGQAWKAATGYGAGSGHTVEEVVEAGKAQNKPIGSGKIAKTIVGPSGIEGVSSNIAAKEQEVLDKQRIQQEQAKHRAEIAMQNQSERDRYASERASHSAEVNRINAEYEAKKARYANDVNMRNQLEYERKKKLAELKTKPFFKTGKFGGGALGAVLGAVGAPLIQKGIDYLKPEEKSGGGAVGHFAEGRNVPGKAGAALRIGKGLTEFLVKPTKKVKASEALGAHEGKYLGLTQTDNFGVHGDRMGGNQFPNFQNIKPAHQKEGVVWMTDAEKHANDIVKRGGKDTIFSTYIGSPNQLKSNKTVFEDILKNHYDRTLTPDQIKLINNRIATARPAKDKPLIFPNAFDISDQFATREMGGDTFARRAALADILGMGKGVGLTKNGIALPDYENILKSHRDPLTQGVPTSSVGTRLFDVDPNRPSQFTEEFHPDYNWSVYGKDQGVQFDPVPQNIAVPDWHGAYKKRFPDREPHGNAWFSYMNEPQFIDEAYLTKMQKEGFAEGGEVGHFADGRGVPKLPGKAGSLLKLLGLSDEAVEAWQKANKVSQRQTRVPQVQQAAQALREGQISAKEYRDIVQQYMPIKPFTSVPNMPTPQEMAMALHSNKLEKGLIESNLSLPKGTRVGSRLDIPAYEDYDKWVASIHEGSKSGGNALGYAQTAHLTGDKGPIQFMSSPKAGLNIAVGTNPKTGESVNKSTIARIHGDWEGTPSEDVYKRSQDLLGHPDWAQVGMNPFRHSYFYDKADMTPVVSAEEVLQVGPLVLAKKPKKVDPDDPQFRIDKDDPKSQSFKSGGGAWTRSEGKNPEGGLNAIGRASLKAQGHDIKPPQPEGGSRKDSFCARMGGMKKKLTSSETANDPDSRINKALRKWKC